MVVAEQVQDAMDGQVRPVLARALALFGGLAGDDRRADHEIPEQARSLAGRRFSGKAQYVRRVVLVPVLPIEAPAGLDVDDEDVHFDLATTQFGNYRYPRLERFPSWHAGAASFVA